MKISGFTLIRNGIKYDYPFVESIKSLLPLVDELVIAVGKSEDDTLQKVLSINDSKIKIVETIWDENLREGGKVLAAETDKAKAAVSPDSDWLIYLQTDELIHEKYYPIIKAAMHKYKDDKNVDGLLFHYHHFFGSYQYIADGIKWYNKEIRIVRNDKSIYSYKDAQGFRKGNDEKLKVKLIDAFIYHYGWVKNPINMFKKHTDMGKWWRNDEEQKKYATESEQKNKGTAFDFNQIDSLALFTETHPEVMKNRIESANWEVEVDVSEKHFTSFKQKLFYWMQKKLGWRPGEYKNYKKI
ncbi:MAG: hypothetical protein RL065_1689 [Bacteroidota bacterium]|jgi:hypothetical protein